MLPSKWKKFFSYFSHYWSTVLEMLQNNSPSSLLLKVYIFSSSPLSLPSQLLSSCHLKAKTHNLQRQLLLHYDGQEKRQLLLSAGRYHLLDHKTKQKIKVLDRLMMHFSQCSPYPQCVVLKLKILRQWFQNNQRIIHDFHGIRAASIIDPQIAIQITPKITTKLRRICQHFAETNQGNFLQSRFHSSKTKPFFNAFLPMFS